MMMIMIIMSMVSMADYDDEGDDDDDDHDNNDGNYGCGTASHAQGFLMLSRSTLLFRCFAAGRRGRDIFRT